MTWYLLVSIFIALLGAVSLSFQIYKMVELDAKCRNLKHPTLWAFLSLSGNNGSGGLVLYLLGRKNYPVVMTDAQRLEMESRKKRSGVSLAFLVVGAIVLFAVITRG